MRVNVGPIRRKPSSSVPIDLEIDDATRLLEESEVVLTAPVRVEGSITNTGKGYLAQGRIRSHVQLACSRCLKSFSMPLDVPFCERFVAHDEQGAHPVEWDDAALDEEGVDELHYFSGDHIDLSDTIREQILVSVPMKPVCDEACQGICATCGADLSAGPCGCDAEASDLRLAPLADWLAAHKDEQGASNNQS